jgi:hypothetical protein
MVPRARGALDRHSRRVSALGGCWTFYCIHVNNNNDVNVIVNTNTLARGWCW